MEYPVSLQAELEQAVRDLGFHPLSEEEMKEAILEFQTSKIPSTEVLQSTLKRIVLGILGVQEPGEVDPAGICDKVVEFIGEAKRRGVSPERVAEALDQAIREISPPVHDGSPPPTPPVTHDRVAMVEAKTTAFEVILADVGYEARQLEVRVHEQAETIESLKLCARKTDELITALRDDIQRLELGNKALAIEQDYCADRITDLGRFSDSQAVFVRLIFRGILIVVLAHLASSMITLFLVSR